MKADLLILGVLHRGDMHPYEIKRRLTAARVDQYVDVDVGSLYYAVRQLARDGLIAAVGEERVARGGARTTYTLTPAGRTRFQALLMERIEDRTPLRLSLYPALPFLHLADTDALLPALRQRAADLATALDCLDGVVAAVGPAIATGTRLLLDNVRAHIEVEIIWQDRLIDTVAKGEIRDADLAEARRLGLLPAIDPPAAAPAGQANREQKT